ncbi:RRP15-like protein [Drosophila novamexicana]|uniref:RRP15-like protein n=1 Tax=Drosophila novamexicana TaxID=47314 RepID=UPI0011E5EF1A|nr:RRP15-like protein [Drosophila novamexicana]
MMTLSSVQKAPPAADSSSDSGEECEVSACNSEGNPAWARTIAKLLKQNPPENQKRTVLSRAKKLKPNNARVDKAKKTYDFEIDGTEVEVPKKGKDIKKEKPSELDAHLTSQQRKNVPLQLRVKPNAQDLERERNLRKVATSGTVQFYNAVRIQQKELQQQLQDAGPLDSRKDAVLNNIDKGKFLDVLMSGKRARSAAIDNRVKKEELESGSDDEDSTDDEMPKDAGNKKKSEWNVLREDFMTNKKIKHWDEEEEEQDDEKAESDAADSEED